MIGAESVAEILSVYRKHGWTLRRVLLSDALKKELEPNFDELFGSVAPASSALDGLWFSRVSRETQEAWELRHLSAAPFALVEVIGNDTDETAREKLFADTELRMQTSVNRKKQTDL